MSLPATRQFIRFSVVGVVNTALSYVVFLLLLWSGAHYLVASVVGYFCGIVNSYVLNRRWTFQSRQAARLPEFLRFCVVNAVGLALNTGVLHILVAWFGVSPEIAQLFALCASMIAGFIGNKLWTFNRWAPAPSA